MPVRSAPPYDFPTAGIDLWRDGLVQLRDAHAARPGAAARVAVSIDAGGKLTPPGGDVILDTHQGAPSDFLDFVALGAVDDGASVALGIADAGRPITLRHLMAPGGDADAGPL